MQRHLVRPCANCPFRTDREFYLHPARRREIARGLLNDQDFACHKTTKSVEDDEGFEDMVIDDDTTEACAGAMIVLEKMNRPTQMMRIEERIGFYDASKLVMDSPVYKNLNAFIAGNPTTKKARKR